MSNDIIEPIPGFLEKAQKWVIEYPGFFKPYQNAEDVLFTLASPVIAPVVFTVTSCECLVLSLLVELLAIPVAVMASLFGAIFNSPEWGTDAFDTMTSLAKDIFVASVTYLGLALISIVGAPIGLVTRTAASIIDGVIKLFSCDAEDMQSPSISLEFFG
ncbi:hypothetical protein [Legionella fallonii]|uniref:hypothetical protein n=1 Tax=Legionella fallonii TaxID=96230 RepID=UPI0012EDD697|nr:hypothetical protein [Legionella fallonii]